MHSISAISIVRTLKTHQLLCAAATALAAMVLTAGTVSAAGLVEPVPSSEASSITSTKGSSPQAIRDQLVRIDLGYLESNLVPRGIDRARDRLRRAPAGGSARIELFPGVSVTLDRSRLEKAQGRGFIWSGDVRGGKGGYGILVISGDQVTGQIQTGVDTYRISPVESGVHRVSEIDMSKFPGDIVIPVPARKGEPVKGAPEANPEARPIIRVLIPYTRLAMLDSGNIRQDANLAIALANKAARKGGALLKYKLVGTVKVRGFNDTKKTPIETLSAMTEGIGPFSSVIRARDRKKADLVSLLKSTAFETCGVAWTIINPSQNSTADMGFSVVGVNCITDHSVAHEMGHNIGLLHDRFSIADTWPKTDYRFGYVNVSAKLRTVMATPSKCRECVRVPMFSTPRKKYNRKRMGKPKGRSGAADAARLLNDNAKTVSGYR